MSTEPKESDDIVVMEEKDGGAVVELPDHLAPDNDGDDEQRAEGGSAGDSDREGPIANKKGVVVVDTSVSSELLSIGQPALVASGVDCVVR